MTHRVVPTSFSTSTAESVRLYLEQFTTSLPKSLISISFLWQNPDIQHYLVSVYVVDIIHVKPCQNLYFTRRSRPYAIGIYHLLHSQYLRVKECQCRNLQASSSEQDDEICVICIWDINIKDPEFQHSTIRGEPHGITQNELDYLGNDLELPKLKTDLLMSRLQQWNFLDDDMKAPAFRFRQRGLFQNV